MSLLMIAVCLPPAFLVMHTEVLSFTLRALIVSAIATLGLSLAVPVRQGVWILLYWTYLVAGRSMPSQVHRGVWSRGRVQIIENGTVSEKVKRLRRAPLRALRTFADQPRAEVEGIGLLRVSTGGWRAVARLDGPALAPGSAAYGRWCDVTVSWLAGLDCPAQVITVVGHLDRTEAELAWEDASRFEPRGGPLAHHERLFAGDMAATSLALTHYVIWAPQSAAGDGIPHHSSVHRAAMAPTAGRSAAERMLESALRLAADRGISAKPAPADEVSRLLGRESVLAAEEAAATREELWVAGAHVAILTVTKLPPDVDYGVIVEALQRARARGLVSLHLIPTRAEAVRKALRQQRGAIRHALQQGGVDDVDLTVALDDIRQLEGALAERRVSGLRIAISIAVRAPTQSACAEARERLEALLFGYGFHVVHPTVPGFVPAMAMAPGTAPLRRALHLTTDAVAARLLPILGTPFADVEAPLVGRNLRTGASAYLSVWSRRNFNVACVGSSGAGKSTTTKLWLVRHCMQGANAVVLDPDSEYEGVIGLLGGRYHELADSAINPLGFGGRLDCDDAAEIMVAVLSVMGGETVAYAAGRPVRRLPGEDKAWLHQELVAFLAAWRTVRGLEEPVLSALLEHLGRVISTDPALSDSQRDRYQRICQRLSGYCHGSMGRIFDRPSSFRLEKGIPVGIGFRSLSMRYASDPTPAIAVVLSHVLEAMSLKRERLIVLVDEAHVLTSDPDAGQVLEQLVRRARKSRAGVWMASQRIEEFIATDLGRTLAATAATKIVLGHEDTVADRVREVFELADDEAAALTPPVAGQAVLISGEERTVVQIMPSPVLWPWVRTDDDAQDGGTAA